MFWIEFVKKTGADNGVKSENARHEIYPISINTKNSSKKYLMPFQYIRGSPPLNRIATLFGGKPLYLLFK